MRNIMIPKLVETSSRGMFEQKQILTTIKQLKTDEKSYCNILACATIGRFDYFFKRNEW